MMRRLGSVRAGVMETMIGAVGVVRNDGAEALAVSGRREVGPNETQPFYGVAEP